MGALAGFVIFSVSGVVRWREADGVFTEGMKMMAMIGFIMIAAAGFAEVMRATGAIGTLCRQLCGSDWRQSCAGGAADVAGRAADYHGHRFVVLGPFRSSRQSMYRWQCSWASSPAAIVALVGTGRGAGWMPALLRLTRPSARPRV